jgi:hypothetical protein
MMATLLIGAWPERPDARPMAEALSAHLPLDNHGDELQRPRWQNRVPLSSLEPGVHPGRDGK